MSIRQELMKQIDKNRNEAVEFLQSLIKVPTFVPPGNNYDEIARIVRDKMEDAGCLAELVQTPNDPILLEKAGAKKFTPPLEGVRVNALGTIKGQAGSPTFVLNGHLDTVPVAEGWKTDPFGGRVIDDAVYGRGASDDKGGVCAMIMAFKALKNLGIKLKGNALLAATVDEEVGGFLGLGYLVDNGFIKGNCGICVDGIIDNVCIASNGRVKYNVHTYGKAVHSGTPHLGINAIEPMAKVVLAVQDYGRELLKRRSSIPAPSNTGMDFIYPSATVGIIRGGTKENIVPEKCTITLNRRLTPEETVDEVRREFKNVVDTALRSDPQARWEIEEVGAKEGYFIPLNDPIVSTARKIAQEVSGQEVPVCGYPGGTDMTHMKRTNVKMVIIGPGSPTNRVHAADENLPISNLTKLTKICALMALETLT